MGDVAQPLPCSNCDGLLWVCEDHPDKPWGDENPHEFICGAAGMPCPVCNTPADGQFPAFHPGSQPVWFAGAHVN